VEKHIHRFDEALWSAPGAQINYDQTQELQDEINLIRRLYPELNHWGDLALFMAWGSYSQDTHALNWSPVADHDDTFLAYLWYVEQGGNIVHWSAETAQQVLDEKSL
jgi:hypothetical protein